MGVWVYMCVCVCVCVYVYVYVCMRVWVYLVLAEGVEDGICAPICLLIGTSDPYARSLHILNCTVDAVN